MSSLYAQKMEAVNKMLDCIKDDKGIEFIKLLNQFECLVIGKCNEQIGEKKASTTNTHL